MKTLALCYKSTGSMGQDRKEIISFEVGFGVYASMLGSIGLQFQGVVHSGWVSRTLQQQHSEGPIGPRHIKNLKTHTRALNG